MARPGWSGFFGAASPVWRFLTLSAFETKHFWPQNAATVWLAIKQWVHLENNYHAYQIHSAFQA